MLTTSGKRGLAFLSRGSTAGRPSQTAKHRVMRQLAARQICPPTITTDNDLQCKSTMAAVKRQIGPSIRTSLLAASSALLRANVGSLQPDKTAPRMAQPMSLQQEQFQDEPIQCQPFQYLCILDFEATCDSDPHIIKRQEILEFPVVVVDTSTRQVIAEFQHFCRPVVNPRLTEFCKQLSGIAQEQVDSGLPFGEVLHRLDRFLLEQGLLTKPEPSDRDQAGAAELATEQLRKAALSDGDCGRAVDFEGREAADLGGQGPESKLTEGGHNFVFVTCGDWDLRKMLPGQMELAGLGPVPKYLTRWVNIKHLMQRQYGKAANGGMAHMLEFLHLELIGRHHSGLDDARNIARLAIRMMEDGCIFEPTTSSISPPSFRSAKPKPEAQKPGGGNSVTLSQGGACVLDKAQPDSTEASSKLTRNPKNIQSGSGEIHRSAVLSSSGLPASCSEAVCELVSALFSEANIESNHPEALTESRLLLSRKVKNGQSLTSFDSQFKQDSQLGSLVSSSSDQGPQNHANFNSSPAVQLPEMFDIGVNLGHPSFAHHLEDTFRRALDARVAHMSVTGSTVEGSRHAVQLCQVYGGKPGCPSLVCTAGVHPNSAQRAAESPGGLRECMGQLAALVRDNKDVVRAIGECGLDFDRQFSSPEVQEEFFEAQIQLALQERLPLFLHERSAHQRFVDILAPHASDLMAVAHCFTGSKEELQRYLDMGFYMGVTGWVCDERRGQALQEAVPLIPLDRLLIETDAPFLRPRNIPKPMLTREQKKHGVNEPAFLFWVAKKIAKLRQEPVQRIIEASTRNAQRFFEVPDH